MSMGAFGWLSAKLYGKEDKPAAPGLFAPGTVGGMYGDYLKDMYRTPTDQSPLFKRQSMVIRDALSQESDTAKDELTAAANSEGFFDSGARIAGLSEINRNRIAAYSQSVASLLAKMESDKLQAAFPYLQAQIGEYGAYQGALGARNQRRQNDIYNMGQNVQQSSATVMSMFGGGGMGGGGGGGGGGYV